MNVWVERKPPNILQYIKSVGYPLRSLHSGVFRKEYPRYNMGTAKKCTGNGFAISIVVQF